MPSIQHKNIPDSAIHEPKRIVSAVTGSLERATGAGITSWSPSFISTDQTISGSVIEVSHGLGTRPLLFSCYLKNVISMFEYVPGDMIPIVSTYFASGTPPAVYANSTKIGVVWIPSAGLFIPRKTASLFGFVFLSGLSSWKLVFKGEI